MSNLSEDELTTNNDPVLEAMATTFGVSRNKIKLNDVKTNTDGTLTVSVLAPAYAVKPDDFESQVETGLNNISGLEDVIVEGNKSIFLVKI